MRNRAHIWLGVIGWLLFGVAMILAIVGGAMPAEVDGYLSDVPNAAKLGVQAWASSLEMAAYPFLAAWLAVYAIRWKPAETTSAKPGELQPWDEVMYREWLQAEVVSDTPVARERFAKKTGRTLPSAAARPVNHWLADSGSATEH